MPVSCNSPSNCEQLRTSGYPEPEKLAEEVIQQQLPTRSDTNEPALKSYRMDAVQGQAKLTVTASKTSEASEYVPSERMPSDYLAAHGLGVCNVHVSVKPPDAKERPARDIACVIDISGSMATEATIQDSNGNTESHGLSLLDIAKHGVRTIINTLDAKDRLAIVSFDNCAATELPLMHMNAEGRVQAEQSLEALQPRGGTYMWTGLEHGLEALRGGFDKDRQGHVMLLTDGIAHDKNDVKRNFQAYLEKRKGKLPGIVSTFGFGYQIDSELLVEVSTKGSGSYSFIPDASFVGTVFIHAMSNSVVTMANEAYLEVKPGAPAGFDLPASGLPGIEIITAEGSCHDSCKTLGGFPVTEKDGCFRMNIGSLQYGQTRDIIVPVRVQEGLHPMITASLEYETAGGNTVVQTAQSSLPEAIDESSTLIEFHRCRAIFTEAISKISTLAANNRCQEAVSALRLATEQVESSPARKTAFIEALLTDMTGQCTEAVSKDAWFQKWGKHFLPSILFAHKLQQCNNFKDPGVQHYGGELFHEIRTVADDVFNTLPAPKPSVRARTAAARAAPVNMASYNNCYGG